MMSASLTHKTNLIFFSMLSFVAIFIIKLEGERRDERGKERKKKTLEIHRSSNYDTIGIIGNILTK